MPEVLAEFLASILRHFLTGLAVYFVAHGYFTQSQAENYVAAAIAALLGLSWAFWQKYKSRILFLTALDAKAGTAPELVETRVANGAGVPLAAILVPVILVAGLGLLSVGCTSALANFAKVTSAEINTVPKLACNPALTVPGCLTDEQVRQIEGDLHTISTAGVAYTQALIAVNGNAAKAILPFAVFIAEVGAAEADIAKIAGPNGAAVLQAIKDAVRKL